MCGGFVVSYTAKDAQEERKPHWSHVMYGAGKVASYTIMGAAFGLLGSIVAFTPQLRGFAGILAGIFLVLFGLKMLNLFPMLRKLQLKTPGFVSKLSGKSSKSPLVIGLLNGLMIACGPLQAIYIMAAGTGSVLEGAKMLFVFGLGTLPVMLGFGYFASFVSSKLTHRLLKASGILVIVMGLLMVNTGLALTGSGYDMRSIVKGAELAKGGTPESTSSQPENAAVQKDGYQEIRMDVVRNGWKPDTFILKKGVPVHWIINGKEVLSCNGGIQVPKYNLKFKINEGEQVIEFTPTESGVVPWSCWMGMIPGTFIVVDDLNNVDTAQIANTAAATSTGGSCNMGGSGGCGCGMMN
jgi:sulfite exporter TauE/SafE